MHAGDYLSEKLWGILRLEGMVGVVVAGNCLGENIQLSGRTARLVS